METLFDVVSATVNHADASVGGSRDCTAYGKVAEHLAISKLLGMGHKVAVPVADDDGVDLVVDYRLRIQVKNTYRKRLEVRPGHRYWTYGWGGKPGCWAKADFFLFFGRSDSLGDRWWVVPQAVVLNAASSITLYEGSSRGLSAVLPQYEDAWELLHG